MLSYFVANKSFVTLMEEYFGQKNELKTIKMELFKMEYSNTLTYNCDSECIILF